MKKRVLSLILVCLLCACMTVAASAAGENPPCVVDHANLLSAGELAGLTRDLEAIARKYGVEVAVVTVDSSEGLSHRRYAEKIYEEYGYGLGADADGVLLLVVMDPRDRGWYILGNGLGADAMNNRNIDIVGDFITPYLKNGDYADAFSVFADECENCLDAAIYGEPFNAGKSLVVSLVIGLVIALIVTGVMKGKLKTVRPKHAAADYVRPGSMDLRVRRDLYLYRTVSRRPRPKSTSSGGSSGSRRSGGGRSF